MDNFLVIKQHLIDAGCDEQLIDSYLSLHDGEQITQQLNMLIRHRRTLLTALHKTQRQIDCLDYLIYNIKKNNCCQC